MKIVLATLQDDLHAYGLRCLASVLRARGVETTVLHLGRYPVLGDRRRWRAEPPEVPPAPVVERVLEACDGAVLVGFSVMTLYARATAALTETIRARLGTPVAWGGIHATVRPEECLRHADMAFLGEAEETLAEAADRLREGRALDGVAGVWLRRDGGVVRNPIRPPPADLDVFPHPDPGVEGHRLRLGDRLEPVTPELLLEATRNLYMAVNARGCPNRCTYCCNSQYGRIFEWSRVRARSVPRVIDEFKNAVRRLPGIEGIKLSDDAFGDLPVPYVEDFARAYKAEVGLPLGIPGWSAANMTEEKIRPLVDAGLEYVRIGIQSGSPRIRRLYGRADSNEEIVRAVGLVHRYGDRIRRLKLDMITDNPWETPEDSEASIRLLLRLPKPYVMTLFSLTLYPGTPLHEKAVREGLAVSDEEFGYGKHFYAFDPRRNLNRILTLFSRRVVLPERFERLLSARRWPWLFAWRHRRYLAEVRRMEKGLPPVEGSAW